ncbi:Type III restriction enzyme res subunit SNF2 family N terminal domain [Trypanosoma vivax]|uniref:Putative DNA excision repair protein n=1 Tax=Trypanosoma vivax (strain Y486) TaxID=1055687 RepID=G0TYN0_TRYVY|nr:putative DNA excision repair protein [Trypanosoma vivax]KAH8611122.1 Type III restriction enzyme res subunit SNF2 family N terminal domain [Trypanosoma vivax]CCC49077.1 putative DNA excision repair protein [Trypanosoma vivax Y486]
MADELSELGVNWVEESLLRNDVEAVVEASTDAAVAEDEAELKKRWAALEEIERTVAALEEQHALALARTPKVFFAGSGSSKGENANDKRQENVDPAVLQFMLLRAKREMEDRTKAIRRWQIEMETRKRQRLDEAKRRRQMPEHKAAAVKSYDGVCDPPHVYAVKGMGRTAPSPAPSFGTTTMPLSSSTSAVGRHNLITHPGVISVADGAMTRRPQNHSSGVLSHSPVQNPNEVPLTAASYSGGSLLPSLYRVKLTRTDVRSKIRRYADDGDLEQYRARRDKRQRLERVVCLAASESSVKKSVKVEASPSTITAQTIKQECCVTVGVKKEVDVHSQSGSGATILDAIDVDALMEDSDDVGERVIQQVLADKHDIVTGDNAPAPSNFIVLAPGISLQESVYQRLLEYQKEGVSWLLGLHQQRVGGILGDEMGLGKTVQVAVMLNALSSSHKLRGPCLIVAPLTVLRQWVAEMHRWAPYMRTCVMHGSSSSSMTREQLLRSVKGTPAVVLSTYSAVRQHCCLLHEACFQYIILDEGHKISNPEAIVTLAVKSFPTPHRIILSGTPIQNTLKELWCLFDFVRPGLLGTMSKFVEEFEKPINLSKNLHASPLALATAVEQAKVLRECIAPFLLRRLKRQVLSNALPEKYERVIRCPLSDSQLEAYVELLTSPRVQTLLSQCLSYSQIFGRLDSEGRDEGGSLHIAGKRFHMMGRGGPNHIRLEAFSVMHELRQICNHVDIFRLRQAKAADPNRFYEDDDDDDDGTAVNVDASGSLAVGGTSNGKVNGEGPRSRSHLSFRSNHPVNYAGSGKLHVLLRLLNLWRCSGQRALVFSQTRAMLDIIENMCEQEGFVYIRMDGSTNSHHRQELMDRFNEDDRILVALLTTRVGGIGVNLIGADRVVLFDPDWNPVTDEQARERAWRIGQTRNVGVYRLIASGTLEESILRRQLAKTYVTEKVLQNPALQRFFHEQGSLAETFYLGAEYDSRVPVGKKHVLVAQELTPLLEEEHGAEETVAATEGVVKEENAPSFGSFPAPNTSASVYKVCAPPGFQSKNSSDSTSTSTNSVETALLQDLVNGQEVYVSGCDETAQHLARISASQAILRVTNTVRTLDGQRAEVLVKLGKSKMQRG